MTPVASRPPGRRPRLRVAATLWSLAQHPSVGREWPLERKVAAIKAAGFAGVQAGCRPELFPLLREHGLAWLGAFDAVDARHFKRQIAECVTGGAIMATAQIGEHDTPTKDATALVQALLSAARKQGLRVQIETHRDTATETPEKFAAIAQGYRKATGRLLPVTWDHSHFALVKHLRATDFIPRLLADSQLVQHSRCFHCRPFNGHHCQIPVRTPAGRFTPEFRDWLVFVQALFSQWLDAARDTDELWIVAEQGAAFNGYNLSGFNPPWEDAILCARALRRTWSALLKTRVNGAGH